jgi:hypothetical protein
MTNEEFESVVKPLHEARPFQPFVIEMNDGARHAIEKPLGLGYRDGTFVCAAKGRGPRIYRYEDVGRIVPANREMAAA